VEWLQTRELKETKRLLKGEEQVNPARYSVNKTTNNILIIQFHIDQKLPVGSQ